MLELSAAESSTLTKLMYHTVFYILQGRNIDSRKDTHYNKSTQLRDVLFLIPTTKKLLIKDLADLNPLEVFAG